MRQLTSRGGAALMLVACGILTASDAGSKTLSAGYPLGEIIFVRCAVLCVMLPVIVKASGQPLATLRPHRLKAQAMRGLLFLAATYLYLWSLSLLPLPTVAAVMFLSPVLVATLSWSLLGERVGGRVWLALLVGLAGVLIAIGTPVGAWQLAMVVPIMAAFAAALRDISTRRVAKEASTLSIVFFTNGLAAIASLATLPMGWRLPTGPDAVLFLAVGIAQGIAYVAQVHAYRIGDASGVTAAKYSTVMWALPIAYLAWGDIPTAASVLGAAIVVASGCLLLFGSRPSPAR